MPRYQLDVAKMQPLDTSGIDDLSRRTYEKRLREKLLDEQKKADALAEEKKVDDDLLATGADKYIVTGEGGKVTLDAKKRALGHAKRKELEDARLREEEAQRREAEERRRKLELDERKVEVQEGLLPAKRDSYESQAELRRKQALLADAIRDPKVRAELARAGYLEFLTTPEARKKEVTVFSDRDNEYEVELDAIRVAKETAEIEEPEHIPPQREGETGRAYRERLLEQFIENKERRSEIIQDWLARQGPRAGGQAKKKKDPAPKPAAKPAAKKGAGDVRSRFASDPNVEPGWSLGPFDFIEQKYPVLNADGKQVPNTWYE